MAKRRMLEGKPANGVEVHLGSPLVGAGLRDAIKLLEVYESEI